MSSQLPPNPNVSTFNPAYWFNPENALTATEADLLYLKFPVSQAATENFVGPAVFNSSATFVAPITAADATISGNVDFTNISSPPHSSAQPSNNNDLCNKLYVDSQSALTAYQLYFNYSVPYTVPSGATYKQLSQSQVNTPTTNAWATSSTAPVLLGAFFNSLSAINIPTSIPAGVWTLLCYANLAGSFQGRVGVFFEIWATTLLGLEVLKYTSPASLLINTISPLIGANSVQATLPTISLVGFTGIGVRIYIQSNVATATNGSVFFQTDNAYSSILTSFSVTQAPDLLSLNNTWTGTNTFNKDTTINQIIIGRGDTNNTNMSITNGTDWVRGAIPLGTQNIAIGQNAPLFNFNNGSFNVALGAATLYATINGSYSTAIGYHSFESSNAGYNTGIGSYSGMNVSGGASNTMLGAYTGFDVLANYVYSTAIGYTAKVTGSNQVVLGTVTETVICPNALKVAGGITLTGAPTITSTYASSNFILATNSGNSNSIQLSPQGNTALSIGSGGNSVFSGNLTSNGTLTANVGIVNIGNLSFTGLAPTITTNSTEILTLATPATTGGFINLNCQSVATPQISINPTFVAFGSNTNYNGFNMTGAAVIQAQTAMDLILRTPSASTNSILIAPKQVTAVSVLNDGTTRFAQQTLYTFGTTITATITLITAAPLKNFYLITAAAIATISLPTASATYAGSDITFRRQTNVAVITFNQTGGAAVFAPFNSNTLAVSASLSATQFSTRFTCDGTNWYQLATM